MALNLDVLIYGICYLPTSLLSRDISDVREKEITRDESELELYSISYKLLDDCNYKLTKLSRDNN